MNTSELIEVIANNDIAIYGAGYAAQNFYTALQIRKLENKIRYFIVTDSEKQHGKIQGIPIKTVKDIVNEKDMYICIAVHEAIKDEIEKLLLELDMDKFIWVHPYIMEIALGNPLEYHKPIGIKKIIQQHSYDNYAFAIRYLAVEKYYEKNQIGYDVYLKALCLQCEVKTAQKRLNNFIRLIEDWDKNGYRQEQEILVDEKNQLIDGTHRLSLACYHNVPYIYCKVFPYSEDYSKVVKESHFITMDILKKSGFNLYELDTLEKTQKKIRG